MDAQWSDAFHHSVHTALTGDHHGYFEDYDGLRDLQAKPSAKATSMIGASRSSANASMAARRRIVPAASSSISTQNHDQVANALVGKRPVTLTLRGLEKVAAALLICAPNIPMLFMGQEYGATTPFTYFTDFPDQELGKAVSEGRKKEYESFLGAGFIDPQSQEAFDTSKLDWRAARRSRNIRRC